jgi:hypothetical protein
MVLQLFQLELLAKLSRALWCDEEQAEQKAMETLAAISLLELTVERTLERSVMALLQRARSEGQSPASLSGTQKNQFSKFYRLSYEERLILAGLYVGHWSYEKLSRSLALSVEEIESLAWRARLDVGCAKIYPAAPAKRGPGCPEYRPEAPWTQRYLDQEIEAGRERFGLQQHLLLCRSCVECLQRYRQLQLNVGQEIAPLFEDHTSDAPRPSTAV